VNEDKSDKVIINKTENKTEVKTTNKGNISDIAQKVEKAENVKENVDVTGKKEDSGKAQNDKVRNDKAQDNTKANKVVSNKVVSDKVVNDIVDKVASKVNKVDRAIGDNISEKGKGSNDVRWQLASDKVIGSNISADNVQFTNLTKPVQTTLTSQNPESIKEFVMQGIRIAINSGNGKAHIQTNIGDAKLFVDISVQDGKNVSLNFSTSDFNLARDLERQFAYLQKSFQDAGLSLSSFNVNTGSRFAEFMEEARRQLHRFEFLSEDFSQSEVGTTFAKSHDGLDIRV
jgi:hypothetical protein